MPTDLWVPVTDTIPPMQSIQYAVGVTHTFRDKYEVSVEGYYKTMENVLEYKEGASFFDSGSDWYQKVEFGRGWSYGGELFIQRKIGKLTGWIGYTLSWTNRQFENLNFGEPFPYRYDRRHDLSVAFSYQLNDHIDFGVTWVYGTGNAVTLPVSTYQSYGSTIADNFLGNTAGIDHFQARNDYRMPAYHRLDLGVNVHKEKSIGPVHGHLVFTMPITVKIHLSSMWVEMIRVTAL